MSFSQAHVSVSADPVKVTIEFIATDEIQSGSLFCNWDYIRGEYSVTHADISLSLVLFHDSEFSMTMHTYLILCSYSRALSSGQCYTAMLCIATE